MTKLVAILALAFSPDGRWLVTGGQGELKVWDVRAARLERRIGGVEGRVRAIAFRPDGQTLALATGIPGRSGAIVLIDFAAGTSRRIADSGDEMLAAAFSADGKWLAFGGTDAKVSVWSMDDDKLVATISEHNGWIQGLSFSPNGKLLASGSADQTVGIWDTADWKRTLRLPLAPSDPVNGVAFSPEGDIVAYASSERAVRIWRTQQARGQTRAIDTGACLPLAVAWIKGPQRSRIVASCTDGTLRAMGPAGNQQVTFNGHTDWVYAVAASPDGSRIASGGADGTIRLWGPAGRPIATLSEEAKP